MSEIIRLPSSVGIGRCLRCGSACVAGWSHMPDDAGFCEECAFFIAGPEFVGEMLALPALADTLAAARVDAVRRMRIARRLLRAARP